MSFYSDASLVMIPSGYKTSKVYCAKPTDGSGDLVFSRSNDTATRVGPDGLIEKVRTNLALYSEDLTNAAWTNFSITVGANATTAPNGTTTADKLTPTASNTNHLIHTNQITSAGEYSFSVYVKAAGYSKVAIRESWTSGDYTSFDLTTGTVIDSPNFYTNTITSVGNGWYRITCTKSFSGNIAMGLIPLLDSYTGGSPLTAYAGNGTSGIFAWGAQMEFNVPTEYIGPTLASAVSVGPVANVPRLDYLGSSCPRLLLEPQRSNLATYSEQANQYTKAAATIGSNVVTSPDGYTNADSLIEDGTTAAHAFYNFGLTTFTAAAHTASVFAKKGGRDWFALQLYDGSSNQAFFNLATGTTGSVTAGSTSTITSMGNGWYRCTITATTAVSAGGIAIYSASANNVITYAGTNGLAAGYFYGWQLELGAYATSYIPTLGAAVTRGADACSKTGISSLIGQTEGTIFVEMQRLNTGAFSGVVPLQLNDGTNNNRVQIELSATGAALLIASSGGAVVANITGPTLTLGQTSKIAVSYKVNDFKIFVNGVLAGTDTSGAVPVSMSRLDLASEVGVSYSGFALSQALHFKTALTSTQLAELTA